ncbi:MAG: hypothetical protein JXR48_19190 [Candidatus Delongbacteria bacterium]|nr:hypothetical protein [Candidatus Delongbacteria bacterium]MBN2837087.1 hypothetical protein [Candidatus Delongbacteria bacterium]
MIKPIILLCTFVIIFSCSDDKKSNNYIKKEGSKSEINKQISNVLAVDGGYGFEYIALENGWLTNDKHRIIGSDKAVKGGSYTRHMNEYPATLRVVGKDSHDANISMISNLVYESLLDTDLENKTNSPLLASHWKIDEENDTFYFRLDPDARWSDGKEVTTDDVLYTWRLLTDEGILAPYTTESYFKFEEPKIISKYIISVKAKEKDFILFDSFSGMRILPAHHLKKVNGTIFLEKYHWNMIPGTGPYLIDDNMTKKGKEIVFKRRENWWGYDKRFGIGAANFNEIRLVIIRDDVLVREKFKKGELDLISIGAKTWEKDFNPIDPEPPFDEIKNGAVQRLEVYNFNPRGMSGLAINMREEPFSDIRVRKAFSMLLNRDQINEKIYYSAYKKIYSLNPGSIYENPDNLKLEYNPSEAGKLLDEAGWSERDNEGFRVKNGIRFEIDLDIMQSSEKIYTIYQEELTKMGIKLNLKYSDWNSMVKRIHERRFKLINMGYTGSLTPYPGFTYRSDLADQMNTNNICGVKSLEIDSLIDLHKKCYDLKTRVRLVQQIDSLVINEVPWIWGWYRPYTERIVYWNRFGFPDLPFGVYGDENNVMMYWWVDQIKENIVEQLSNGSLEKTDAIPEISDYFKLREK